jgi:hypothetical protein
MSTNIDTTTISPAGPSPAGLHQLRSRLSGTLALPGEPGYERCESWNTAVASHPVAVIAAADAADVAEAVRFAGARGLRVGVQCTGHGAVEDLGDDALLIHTGELDGLTIDPDLRRVRIGAGLTWRPVIAAAATHGLAPNVGSAPDVGVAGFLTGGGIGPLVRHFGVASDWVTAIDVVTGEGELLHVTPNHHAELFWGLRGGKSTLGIVCAVEVELEQCERFYGGALYYDGADAEPVLRAWAAAVRDLPDTVDTSLALQQLPALPAVPPPLAGRMTVAVRCASVEGAAGCEPVLGALRGVATPVIDTLADRRFAEIGAIHADPTEPAPVAMSSALLHELPDEAVGALLAVAGPGSGSRQTICELRRLGGAYRRPRRGDSAFCHRGAQYNLAVIGRDTPQDGALVAAHAARVLAAIGPWDTGGTQPNFSARPGRDGARRCYDAATLVRLSALADRYDPAGVLAVGQVVRGF